MVKTNNILSFGGSNTPSALADDIRAIKAPVAVPDVWFWIWLASGLVLALALGWWAWRRWRRRATAVVVPEMRIPPHEKARVKLQEALALLDQPRPFSILVSDTIRVYLEERFRLHAPERTTEEFLEELQSSPLLTFDQKQTLGQFLSGCDLVKFAQYEPARSELQSIHSSALRLVEETQAPALPPPGTVAGATTAP